MNAIFSNKKRFLCVMLCLLLALTFVLSSCGGGGDDNEETTAATTKKPSSGGQRDNTVEDWLPMNKFEDEDGNPTEFLLLNHSDYNKQYALLEYQPSDDPLRAAAYSRTMAVAEKFGVAFSNKDEGDVKGMLQSSVMGGGGLYDLIYPIPTPTQFLEANLITDLATYENIHLDQPWWNDSAEVYNFDGRVFFAASDFSIAGQGLVGMIFNRPLWNDLQLDYDLYKMVDDKTWTMAKLREISMLYGSSADDVYDEKDSYGLIYWTYVNNEFYWACGGRVIDYDPYYNEYSVALETELTSQIGQAIHDLIWNSNNKVFQMRESGWFQFPNSKGWAAYKEGNSLFMTYEIGALFQHLLTVPFELGYMPCPTLNEGEEYTALCASGFFMIPKKTKNPEMSSVVLEACNIISYTDVRPAFFNTILLGRMSERPEDFEMLELLHESKIYDLGYTFNQGGAVGVLELVLDKKTNMIAGYISGHERDFAQMITNINKIRAGQYD